MQAGSTIFGFATISAIRHGQRVLSHDQLLSALREARDAGRVANAAVEKLLKLPSSRVTEIFNGTRRIKLDEAKALVEEFDLGEESVPGLNEQAARIFVLHAAKALGSEVQTAQVAALAQDLQGFVEFATRPEVRASLESAHQFFLGRLPDVPPSQQEAAS